MKTNQLEKKYKVVIDGEVVHSEDVMWDAIDWADFYYCEGYSVV